MTTADVAETLERSDIGDQASIPVGSVQLANAPSVEEAFISAELAQSANAPLVSTQAVIVFSTAQKYAQLSAERSITMNTFLCI